MCPLPPPPNHRATPLAHLPEGLIPLWPIALSLQAAQSGKEFSCWPVCLCKPCSHPFHVLGKPVFGGRDCVKENGAKEDQWQPPSCFVTNGSHESLAFCVHCLVGSGGTTLLLGCGLQWDRCMQRGFLPLPGRVFWLCLRDMQLCKVWGWVHVQVRFVGDLLKEWDMHGGWDLLVL